MKPYLDKISFSDTGLPKKHEALFNKIVFNYDDFEKEIIDYSNDFAKDVIESTMCSGWFWKIFKPKVFDYAARDEFTPMLKLINSAQLGKKERLGHCNLLKKFYNYETLCITKNPIEKTNEE